MGSYVGWVGGGVEGFYEIFMPLTGSSKGLAGESELMWKTKEYNFIPRG